MKRLYLFLAATGFVLSYYFFVSFLVENGPHLPLLFEQLLASDIPTTFAVDLVITAVVFLVFSFREAQRRRKGRWWVDVIATLAVGPSFAFPLFLYVREGTGGRSARRIEGDG